ncbi:Nonsense-mediated mRNA decay protein 2 isoform 1 [Rhynchospora pubera]|uniref:Nonsense-mediated mRNA decay protein 2 isoform 1 n=1 Tax=Rhynchospora pubera TaxID=906938 RepID=A0AAV8CMR2_9POAL|nr:Nonsense-mediated mRNA decay protein 2 isoform 1 [Rhynchospora pubera]
MGKNQAYKAMQRARVGSSSAGPKDVEDGMADGSFHSPEWHAARLASLQTSHTVTWEEFKRKQKEDELKKGEIEADKDRMMREYRAQLDAERAQKLAQGRNHSKFSSRSKKVATCCLHDADRKDKDMKKRSKRKRKHRRSSDSSSSSSSSSEYSSSDSEVGVRDSKRSRSKSRSKRSKKEKRKHRSRSKTKHSSESDDEENGGPVRLSKFFGCAKD